MDVDGVFCPGTGAVGGVANIGVSAARAVTSSLTTGVTAGLQCTYLSSPCILAHALFMV